MSLTNEMCAEWRDTLIADGWEVKPIYEDSYDPDVSLKFNRDGFTIHLYRENNTVGGNSISAWGPDGLSVRLPEYYNFESIKANLDLCSQCGNRGETVRLSFAGRVCPPCREKLKSQYEYRGWCD